jgi:hypothetical protein
MTRYEELETRIDALEALVNRLLGKPQTPISMREYRLAAERRDKVTMRRYLAQFKNPSTTSTHQTDKEALCVRTSQPT